MEDNLKILKVEELSNHWSDLPQILNFSSGDQPKSKHLKWRRPPVQDSHNLLKVEYLGNHWLGLSQILNLWTGDKTKIKITWNEDDLRWKMTSKYQKLNTLITDIPQILNLSSWARSKIKNAWNEDDHQWKMTSKYQKLNIIATDDWIFLKFKTSRQGTKPKLFLEISV